MMGNIIFDALKERSIQLTLDIAQLKFVDTGLIQDGDIIAVGPSDQGNFVCVSGKIDEEKEREEVLVLREGDLSVSIRHNICQMVGESCTDVYTAGHRLHIASLVWAQYPKKEARKILQEFCEVSPRYIRCYLDVITKAIPEICQLASDGCLEIKRAAHIANLNEEMQRKIVEEIESCSK